MTGTALTEATEFMKIYEVAVVEIPTHRPMIRDDHNDQIYKTKDGKWQAVASEIKDRHETGQPILVGTISVEVSEMLLGGAAALGDRAQRPQRGRERPARGRDGRPGRPPGRGPDRDQHGRPRGRHQARQRSEQLAVAELHKLGLAPGGESWDEGWRLTSSASASAARPPARR